MVSLIFQADSCLCTTFAEKGVEREIVEKDTARRLAGFLFSGRNGESSSPVMFLRILLFRI